MVLPRLLSCMIGYVFGCVLTGEIIAYQFAGKSAAHLGETGNPGMANIMATLGFVPGILVLAGDIVKTARHLGAAVSRRGLDRRAVRGSRRHAGT